MKEDDAVIVGYKGITTQEQYDQLKETNPEAYALFHELFGDDVIDKAYYYAPYIPVTREYYADCSSRTMLPLIPLFKDHKYVKIIEELENSNEPTKST